MERYRRVTEQPVRDCVTFGETMALLVPDPAGTDGRRSFQLEIGGAESNVAIALARLGHRASWVGRVGPDAMGDLVLRTLRAEGVDVSGVRRDPASTGVVFFERRLPTMQRVSYMRTGSAATQLCPADVDVPPGTRVVHVTGVTAALGSLPRATVFAAVEQARERGALELPLVVGESHLEDRVGAVGQPGGHGQRRVGVAERLAEDQ